MGIAERISDIEKELQKTQVNKATMGHICRLKSRLAQLRNQLLESEVKSSASGGGQGFAVERTGDCRVALLGFPSVGKSSLLNILTDTKSQISAIEFTTLTCIPGNLRYNNINIQLLDLPGIIEGASQGKGRGKEVLGVLRSADCCLMMVDADKAELQQDLLTQEVEAMGIRLNKKPPNISLRLTKTGGVKVIQGVPLTKIDPKQVVQTLYDFKIHNAEVLFREDASIDEVIDVASKNRVYMPCITVINKIDQVTIEEIDRLARLAHTVPISCSYNLNLDRMLMSMWEHLDVVRVYTKPKGGVPDFEDPVVLRRGGTVQQVCQSIHSTLVDRFKYAIVNGASAKHKDQRVGLTHELCDEDIITVIAR